MSLIGILPAAGAGTRLAPFRYPKELLPVVFSPSADGTVQPRLAIERALEVMACAPVDRAVVVIADWKLDLVRVLGDGRAHGVPVAYVHRAEPRGLPDAIDAAWPWVADRPCALVLPDTVFEPRDALDRIARTLLTEGLDLVLAVFPTDRPHALGPVRHDSDGEVQAVLDKPSGPCPPNTWGAAAWSGRFGRWLHAHVDGDVDVPLGTWFDRARAAGMRVRAVPFPEGRYIDVGTARALAELLAT